MTSPGPGTVAVRRVTGQLLGWLTVLTTPAWAIGATLQAPGMARWWNVVVLLAIGGSAVALVVSGLVRDLGRRPAVAMAAAVLFAVLTWPLAVTDVEAAATRLPWPWLIIPLGLAAVAILDSLLASTAYGVVVALSLASYRTLDLGGAGPPTAVALEALLILSISIGLALIVRAAWAAARRVDDDAAKAAEERAATARLATAAATRSDVDAVLHDQVLAALTVVVRSPTSRDVAPLARDALAALEAAQGEPGRRDGRPPVGVAELRGRIEATVRMVAPTARFSDGADPDVQVPEPVTRAVVEAAAEAVRNSMRHGHREGRPPEITIELSRPSAPVAAAAPDRAGPGLRVVVRDDGPGFDPAAVAPERLGLDVSIRGRMRAVGGSALVTSRPGSGTAITLTWPAADEPAVVAAVPGAAETERTADR